nr:glycoside hydrolase family 2 TIM barrel-domain containing protein [Kibdelosporangium sp. MJ126-NF4]CEL21945.1 Beta-mannosidase [Kibdelosporangium sp. MJ126-NF4]CTQ92725.1 Beta-mannosidase (EC 3.2.1.25) [Kibdelosporangium sp. MJ126-NF4]
MRRRRAGLAALAASAMMFSLLPVAAASGAPTLAVAAGQVTTIPDWRLQTSRTATSGGNVYSDPSFNDSSWLPVAARSTVMAGLIANNKYADVNFGDNLKSVNRDDFSVPWWYRKSFTAQQPAGTNTFLKLKGGIIARAEVWVNGTKVAGTDTVIGAYPTREYNVTSLIRNGTNAIAIKAMPSDPTKDLLIHFVDWTQLPPDRNQGLFRDVQLANSGAVSLRDLRVSTDLPLPNLTTADVTVKVNARNDSGQAVSTQVTGTIDGLNFTQPVSLAAGETKTVTFNPGNTPGLRLTNPRVWWPFTMGGQPMYTADVSASVGGTVSDSASTTFGVREITSQRANGGGRQFIVNGKPFLVRGGGWASDLFLRTNLRNIQDQMNLVRSMNLNTIRLEGKPENDEFYDMADRLGIMVLTGWECCSAWEAYSSFNAEKNRVAGESAESEGKRIRNHPSVLGFLIASDLATPATQEKIYLDALARAEWNLPIIASASNKSSPQLGNSGMKMDGPYWWEPPVYWYNKQLGGAAGFASEIGPGPTIPEMDELKKFLTQSQITSLTNYNTSQYHLSPSGTFAKLSFWGTALDNRYGKPATVDDLVRKAQLANYETNRAQLEAYADNQSDSSNPSTGVIYWMLNDPWPKLFWHLYNYNLATAGSYFGAKTALRPLHVQYSYDDKSLSVVNTGLQNASGLSVQVTLFNADGTQKANETRQVSSTGNATVKAGTLPQPSGLSTTYFARLLLKDSSGKVVDRNVYWLSTKADTLNYNGSDWYFTPQSGYADLKGLNSLSAGSVNASASSTVEGENTRTTVTITGTGNQVAFFLRASVRKGTGGAEVLPQDWSDNYVTLWPGETLTLTATYRTADLGGAAPVVQLSGHNTQTRTITS